MLADILERLLQHWRGALSCLRRLEIIGGLSRLRCNVRRNGIYLPLCRVKEAGSSRLSKELGVESELDGQRMHSVRRERDIA